MSRRLLILGASRYTQLSVQAARALGCEVVLTDRNPAAPGFAYADFAEPVDITDEAGTLEVARRYEVEGVLALTDFGVRTAAHVAAELGLAGLDPAVARVATDKSLMRQRWRERGAANVEFRVARSLEDARAAFAELGGPVILKPCDSRGGGSRGVRKVESAAELAEAFAFAQSFYADDAVLVEEFVTGLEHSVETISWGGEVHVLVVSDKEKTAPPYRVDKSVIYPTRLAGEARRAVEDAARQAVEAIGIEAGAAHVELCSTESGPRLFELGARPGGGATPNPIVPHVAGVAVIQAVVRIALGEDPGPLTPRAEKGCVYRFLTPRPGTLRAVEGVEEVAGWEGILDAGVLVAPGGEVRPVRVGGDRAGFVVAAGETRDEALELAARAEAEIRFHTS